MPSFTSYVGWGRRAWDEGAWNYDFDEMIIDGSSMTTSAGAVTAIGAAATSLTGIAMQSFSGTINATADLTTALSGLSLTSFVNVPVVVTWLEGNGGGNYTPVSGNPSSWSDVDVSIGNYTPVDSGNNKAWSDISTGAGVWYDA
jgi:hypothetical protein